MSLWFVRGHSDKGHEVGGVTSCRKRTSPLTSLVDWGVIVRVFLNLMIQAGFEPNHGALDEEDLEITLIEESCGVVPLTSFDIHATHVDSVLWSRRVLILYNFVVEDKLINRNLILSGVVL